MVDKILKSKDSVLTSATLKDEEDEIFPDEPIAEVKPEPKSKPKVNLKNTLKKLDSIEELVFRGSGPGRWDEIRVLLNEAREDINNKLKE